MSRTTLYTNDSSTATGIREASFDEILTAAREQMSLRVRRGTLLASPRATRDYLALKLGNLEHEVFAVLFLDKRHRLISYQEMFQGYSPFGRAVRASFPRPATASQAREPDSPPGFSSKAPSNPLRRPVASLDT